MNYNSPPGLDELCQRLVATDAPDTPYEPAITTVHLPIDCLLYRVPGIKTGREHHLLGWPEYIKFLHFDFSRYLNIREQFAVPLELSLHVAERLDIKHPYVWKEKRWNVMTVDFMLSNPGGGWTAVDVKPSAKLQRKRVSDKLKLMGAILELARIPHEIHTEKDIGPATAANYEILHPLALPHDPPPFSAVDMGRVSTVMHRLLRDGTRAVRDAAAFCEQETGLGRGLSIRAALWLIANRQWSVDLTRRLGPDEPVSFLS